MHILWAVAALALILVLAWKFGQRVGHATSQTPPPLHHRYVRTPLLSPHELQFFAALRAATGPAYHICCKVKIGDLITVQPMNIALRNTFAQKHADFVLCDATTMRPLHVIELDDSSHQRPSARARDEIKSQALAHAGLPLTRFPYSRHHTAEQIQHQLSTSSK